MMAAPNALMFSTEELSLFMQYIFHEFVQTIVYTYIGRNRLWYMYSTYF